MSDEIAAFVRARLTEWEQTARQATEGPWIAEVSGETGDCVIPADAQSTREHVAKTQLYAAVFDAEHIAMHDPASVLGQTAAMRAVVDASNADCPQGCATAHTFSGTCTLRWMGPAWEANGQRWARNEDGAQIPAPPVITEWTLRTLASIWSDHPDYQQKWTP